MCCTCPDEERTVHQLVFIGKALYTKQNKALFLLIDGV